MSVGHRLCWARIPLTVLAAVTATWLLLEGTGLLRLNGVLDQVARADPVTAGAVIFVLLSLDALLPVPSTPLMVLAGTVLGGAAGVVLSVAGCMASSATAYGIGRFAGPGIVRRTAGADDLEEMQRWGRRFGRWVFIAARSVPMMPETAGVSAGIGSVPFRAFMGYTLLGTLPLCMVYGLVGSYAETAEQIVMMSVVGFPVGLALLWVLRHQVGRNGSGTGRIPRS